MNKLKKYFNKLWQPDDLGDASTPTDTHVQFLLSYQNTFIGILQLDRGEWTFKYSEEFQQQSDLPPLPDFPDKSREYRSEYLWPLFLTRIPGLNQPKVREIIKEEKINSSDYVQLLSRFGQESISNPFTLRLLRMGH